LELEEAAAAIGQQDLSRRVPVHGSQEFLAVATAFNNMASLLEQEETLRQNMLADVAHELRHPVHILQGNLQAILDDVYPLTKDEIERLVDQTKHLSILVNDLHVLAQAEAKQLPLFKQETDIANLVKGTAASYTSLAAARNINLRVELLGTMPKSVYIDAARMRQAINNLLDNALHHTPDNGTITISVEQSKYDLLIRVTDTGEGISEDQIPYVFERFYRSDKARKRSANSTGLGLAIVKAIVEAHESTIVVTSPGSGQGSAFTISLKSDCRSS
jgi:signal transduction histidine kinase